jgi:ankyrin repeat protein
MPMKFVDIIEYTKMGITKKVAELIANGADVNEKDSNGNYAVICAAQNNDHEIMKLLLWHPY